MTFTKFKKLFKTKYPNGNVWAHDVFEHGVPYKRQKVAVEFEPGGKVYMYRGAYEDILCRVGVKVISKERFAELETRLAHLQSMHGKQDEFFGGIIDYTDEIESLMAEIAMYRTGYVIA